MDAGRFVYLCTWVTTTKSSGHVLCTPSCTTPEVLSGSWSFAEITPDYISVFVDPTSVFLSMAQRYMDILEPVEH